MRKLKIVVLILLLLILGSVTQFAKRQQPSDGQGRLADDGQGWMSDAMAHRKDRIVGWSVTLESDIRYLAIEMVTPCYPEDALRAGAQGRVTSVVRFDEGGNLVLIKILESPHLSISRAVIDAVRQWRIKRLFHAGGEPTRIISELRFQYLIKDGKGRVENSSVEEQTSFSEKFTKVMNEETRKFRPEEPTAKPNR